MSGDELEDAARRRDGVDAASVECADAGDEWLVELTFDNGRRGKTKDARPELPLLIRY
ncbi:MAG TPA: hypothetical protein VE842_00700 [Pyrinomonadaceae bacterium]|jgi:hypothetical protein|nr:hypothetical protein [Pyrinomonadaceae bacterium]